MSVWAIVVAAGTGTRFGGPKQLELLGEKRIIDISCAVAASAVDGVVVVTSPALLESFQNSLSADVIVLGGSSRSESVRAGLAALPADVEVVVVHDAARPLATANLFKAVIHAVSDGADAAIPGVSVSDTIKRTVSGVVVETIDRSELVAVQTPQAFNASVLRRAHESGLDATDDAALVEQLGGKVVVVPGEIPNIKVTTQDDMIVARAHWSAR